LRADEHQLTPPFRQREEERQERGAEQQPRRDAHVDRLRSRRRANHEERADHEHIEQDDVLERECVRGL